MSAEVVELDSRRRQVTEGMFCLMCGARFVLRHSVGTGQVYWPHPKDADPAQSCDEVASVPEWTLQVGR